MPLEELGLKEHVFNILVEAGIDTIGALMMSMKMDANKVLGLPGIGPKAIQNIDEQFAGLKFPEPEAPAEPVTEPVAEPVVQVEPQPEVAPVAPEVAPVVAEVAPVVEPPVEATKEPKTSPVKGRVVEEPEDDEHAKDGVSLDELFSMKPEIFQTASTEDDESADKKKGKKGKKKSVELVLDEERGEVVGRKKHKRGDDELSEDW
jgi:hypothetical protein